MRRYTAFRWFPLIFLLSIVFQLPLVQAQDSSGQTFATYELIVQGTTLDRVCLGQTFAVPFKVQAHVLVAGGSGGRVTVGNVSVRVTSQDASIATADTGIGYQGYAPDVPLESAVIITGVAVGRTSVLVEVAGSNTNRFGSASSFQLQKTIPVRVVACEYEVKISSVWVPTIYKTSALMSLNFRNSRLTSTTGLSFSNNDAKSLTNPMMWYTTVNRYTGCGPGHHREGVHSPSLHAILIDDDLIVSVDYAMIPAQKSFYSDTCPSLPIVDPDCRHYPDGTCPVFPVLENFTPQNIEDIVFPVEGGTITVEHTLGHMQGSAAGYTTITLTPVRQ